MFSKRTDGEQYILSRIEQNIAGILNRGNYGSFGTQSVHTPYAILDYNHNFGVTTKAQIHYTAGTGAVETYDDSTAFIRIDAALFATFFLGTRESFRQQLYGSYILRSVAQFIPSATEIAISGVGDRQTGFFFAEAFGSFGILYQEGTQLTVIQLTVTFGAAGNETVQVTLNGVAYPVNVTIGTPAFNAYQISRGSFAGWETVFYGNTVIFLPTNVDLRNGAYSFANLTGGGACAATITQTRPSVAGTQTFLPQAFWNGSSISGFNPYTQMNCYAIEWGSGCVQFSIFNRDTERFVIVHTYKPETFVSFTGYPAISISNLGSAAREYGIYSKGMSVALLNGTRDKKRFPIRTYTASRSFTGTNVIAAFAYAAVLTSNVPVSGQADLIGLTLTSDGTKVVTVNLVLNPTTVGAGIVTNYPKFDYVDAAAASGLLVSTLPTTYTGGKVVYSLTLGKVDQKELDLKDLPIYVGKYDTLLIVATSVNATDVTATFVFAEDL